MAKYNLYSHQADNPEADMIYLCTCDNYDIIKYIEDSLKFSNSCGGKCDCPYNYYIREID